MKRKLPSRFARLWHLLLAALALAGLTAWLGRSMIWRTARANLEYANLARGVAYVGSEACAECHRTISANWASTAMAQSWRAPTRADPLESFDSEQVVEDQQLGFKYNALQQDGKFYQEEFRLDTAGNKTHSLVREVAYVVGSGKHARSYLAEHNGFVTELPLTWYRSGTWDFSPGYRKFNQRFDREVVLGCTICHNSYPDFVQGSGNRYRTPLPGGIGCEPCHGPGELHVNRQRMRPVSGSFHSAGERDRTIVNPKHLPLEVRDDVCLQCHVQSDVPFPATGKDWMDYRPGLRLGEIRRDFFVSKEGPGSFAFSSHAPRMRLSACWSKGQTRREMTCASCHDPHVPMERVPLSHYVSRCLECHAPDDCSRPPQPSSEASFTNCIACHMPKAPPQDVAHTVITDHWIQKRPSLDSMTAAIAASGAPARPLELIDFWAEDTPAPPAAHAIARARFLDVEPWTGEPELARAARQLERAIRQVPKDPELPYWLGAMYELLGQPQSAAAAYERAARRMPNDVQVQYSLGSIYRQLGRADQAGLALEHALRLCPDYLRVYRELALVQASDRNWTAALESIGHAVSLNPYDSEAMALRADLLFASSGASEATEAAIQDSLRLDPNRSQTLWLWAQVQSLHGRSEDAIETLKILERQDPDATPVLLVLARLLSATGKSDEADRIHDRVRELTRNQASSPGLKPELRSLRRNNSP